MNSTIIFLSPLPPVNQAPCCSDITWLMIRMSIPILSLAASTAPGYMVIDDLDYLAVLMSNSYLYRYNRTTMALNSTVQISSSVALSYYNKQYFISKYILYFFEISQRLSILQHKILVSGLN
jgi:hypothetical protein